MNEIVPESPDKESDGEDENAYVPETPQKDGSPITKSHSIIPIPSLNRIRKSLGVLDNNVLEDNGNIHSPKCRRGTEKRASSASKKSAKLRSYKKDKHSNLQKVKVSLFHSRFKETESEKPSFSVNAKSFYGSSSMKVPESYGLAPIIAKQASTQSSKKKRSLATHPVVKKRSPVAQPVTKKKSPAQPAIIKKYKKRGEINCGVGHGIKRPKRKRSSLKDDSMDGDKSLTSKQMHSATKEQIPIEVNVSQIQNFDSSNIIESSTVVKYDPGKKFFKHSRPMRSSTITSPLVKSKGIDFPVKKKLCIDKASIVASKPVTESTASASTNEYLGLSEKNGELLIEPLINQNDIDDWNKLTEIVDFDISETNMNNLEPIDQVEDLLKILEDDWIDMTVSKTISISTVNDFSTQESNNIQDVNSSIESTPINLQLRNTTGQPVGNSISASNDTIQDANNSNNSNESSVINLGLNDTVSLPVENSSTSAVTNSHKSVTTIDAEPFMSQLLHAENEASIENIKNALETVSRKDMNDLLSILEDDWVQDVEPEENPALKSNTLSIIKTNQTTYNNSITDDSIMEATEDNTTESQNTGEQTTQTSQKYYPLFCKGFSFGIMTDTTKKSKKNNQNSISVKQCSDPKQYQIDAGQKLFGIIQCKECQLPYHLGDKDDEKAHIKYHNRWKNDSVFKFQGWKNECIVFQDLSTKSRIILIEPSDPMSHKKKVLDILQIIDRDLGLVKVDWLDYLDDKVYLYIRNNIVIGLLVSKRVHTAFRMIPDFPELNCCSSETSPVKCGINVVWTAEHHRRKGIATKLVDILRTNYFYGYFMSIDDIAFSMPTPSGKAFVEKYTKTSSFKVY